MKAPPLNSEGFCYGYSDADSYLGSGNHHRFSTELDAVGNIALCMRPLYLSAFLYHRILKLAASEEIQSAHLAEALQYHPKIMMGWYLTRISRTADM